MKVRNTTKFDFTEDEKKVLQDFINELEDICAKNYCGECSLYEFCANNTNKPLHERAVHIRLQDLLDALERGI